jgi:hypothetical protein
MLMTAAKRKLTLLLGIVLLLTSGVLARADYVFSFNTLTPSTVDQSVNIANYMDGILNCIGCVTVSTGVGVDQKYNGDGHVVGPGGVSLTLGKSDGATNDTGPANTTYDSFISNTAADVNGNNPSQLSTQILITFSHGVSLTGQFSFDYEIFPDGTCPSMSSCGGAGDPNLPDLDFVAMAGATTLVNTTFHAVAPSGLTNGNSTHSPNSGSTVTELAPQLIKTWTGTLTGATELEFIDWPSTIGIDNLKVTPEPRGEAFLLGALGLAALIGVRLRRALAKS